MTSLPARRLVLLALAGFSLLGSVLPAAPRITPARPRGIDPALETLNHTGPAVWPAAITRVAILPLHDNHGTLLPASLDQFDQVWARALDATQRAEFVSVSRSAARDLFGRDPWESTTALRPGWTDRLAAATGAQAVFFVDITSLKPYPPLALGFRIKLVRLSDATVLWASDEYWDSQNAQHAERMKLYQRKFLVRDRVGDGGVALTQSPSLFASCAFNWTLRTLPPRFVSELP